MDLFTMAVKAQMPLIQVTTNDHLNVREIISHIIGINIVEIDWEKKNIGNTKAKYMYSWNSVDNLSSQYDTLVNEDRVLILVNCPPEQGIAFDAGILPTPQDLINIHLSHVALEDQIPRIKDSLGGLTLKEIAEVCRLAMATHGELTTDSVVSIRKRLSSSIRGVNQVNTDCYHYIEDDSLKNWVKLNKRYFLEKYHPVLSPRGLLLYGNAGVGKTQGAKYISREFSVPLYHIDIGSILGKYIGDSEGQMNQVLAHIDKEEPCIALFDEIEKIFKSSDDSGVTSRLLARLLWWMQEHSSRVLTIMTSNDIETLPKELYRPGRVDDLIELKGVKKKDVTSFIKSFISSLNFSSIDPSVISQACSIVYASSDKYYRHADIVKAVTDTIKANDIK